MKQNVFLWIVILTGLTSPDPLVAKFIEIPFLPLITEPEVVAASLISNHVSLLFIQLFM